MSKIKIIKETISILRLFGFSDASRFMLFSPMNYFSRKNDTFTERRINVKTFGHEVSLRPGNSDWEVFKNVFIDQEYNELSVVHAQCLKALYHRYLGQGKRPVIIDCGANVGFVSVWYARQFPEATIISIEPERRNFDVLKKNTSFYENVICLNAAISPSAGRVSIASSDDKSWSFQTNMNDAGEIEAITISEAVAKIENPAILIVKIDIEGFEEQLFSSNTGWLDDAPLVVAEVHDWLFPWRGTAFSINSAMAKSGKRDCLLQGLSTFYYSHNHLRGKS